jgi:hypothetical protein
VKKFFTRRDVLLVLSLSFVAIEICVGVFLVHKWKKATIARDQIQNQYKFLSIENWKRFSSAEGGFSALFPGDPETTNLIVDVSTENVEEHIAYVDANVQNTFAVAYSDSSRNAIWAAGTNGGYYLKQIQDGTVSQVPAKLVFQQESKYENYPAREFEYAAGGKANYSVRYKMVLVHQRLYLIYIIFRTADPHPALRAIFFNSFSLNE